MWQSLEEIRQREGLTLNQICTMIDRRRGDAGLTAALRVFIITYFRELLRRTEDGHPTPKEAHQPRGPGQPSDFMRRVLAVFD